MKYRVAIFSPDDHIEYDLSTLDKNGVGGGITSRIRMAHALAQNGHEVHAYVNSPIENKIAGVTYRHYSGLSQITADIFIASTSGGNLDLTSLEKIKVDAKLKILMAHGLDRPLGLDNLYFDFLYALSNFMRKKSAQKWGFTEKQIFVSHRGVVPKRAQDHIGLLEEKDLFAIAYLGHPTKGLDNAIQVLNQLNQKEDRYRLFDFTYATNDRANSRSC
jgi:glycosyltransferase involved in cell wall biosynthesis